MTGTDHLPQIQHQIVDPVFGDVTVTIGSPGGNVLVEGPSLPRVTIERAGDAPVKSNIPIGTRGPSSLVMRVDGEQQELRPAKGGLTRRSYRVRARVEGTDLLFAPRSRESSRLVRGTSPKVEHELGSFERLEDGLIAVEWSADVTVLGVTATALHPEPVEAAVGYALAAAFGTGAQFFLAAFVNGAGQALPG